MNVPKHAFPPPEITLRAAAVADVPAIHALLRPFVMNDQLLGRTEAELAEMTRHGFLASVDLPSNTTQAKNESGERIVGFAAVEIYSTKLAELQCLAVHPEYQHRGVGRQLVQRCIDRARDLDIMEVLAISASEDFLRSCGFDYSLPHQKKALFCQLRPRPKDR